ncbi:hypothetical protein AMAG_02258 [Allomyces macrogynus ATCC 38327]|uniref:sphingomyelin phosphodiesterase n=1 Tax=Allomyces macrogynus (strain ATCC 38327) TaxID=578462 RepID=A0A0L0S1Q0_ALLM3|nr:hypothetical protein AMAG_02258 [Allomyces macrogynus ATCC 38327]|eukprot:KNE56453.1 hypothetical protein AMAG_02258 [Allomyces macrogynus ATCC 38327]
MTTLTLDDPASSPLPPADSITSSNDLATAAAPVAKDNVSNPRPRRRSLAGAHNAPRPASWTATRTVVLVVVVAVCWQAAASLTAQWTHEHGLRLAASAVEASVAPVAGSAALLAAADAASDGHHPANLLRSPPVSAATLRIMTYNFFLRPPFVSDYHGDSKDQRLSEFIARVLPRYDLLALQETFAGYSTRVSALEAAAAALGFVGHVRGPAGSFLRGGYLIDSGLLVLSRWPIVRHAKLTYSSAVTVDKLASKGASYSHHVHPTRQDLHLHVFNTHLQASYETEPDFESDASVRCRSEQLRELAEFVHDHVRAHAEVPPRAQRVERSADAAKQDEEDERVAPDALVPSGSDQIVLAAPGADSAPLPPQDDTNGKVTLTNDDDTNDAPLAQHLILVCGDLNVNSKQTGQHEYRAMLETLARNGTYVVTDLLAAQNRDNYTQVPWEWLTHRRHQLTYDVLQREGARLDYMLLLEPVAEPTAATWKFDVDIDPCQAENPEFVQLSDHMGVAATVALPVTPSAPEGGVVEV